MSFDLGYKCSTCQIMCESFTNNLIYTYYEHWLSKVEILEDESNLLINVFDNLNLHRMIRGITPVLLNYGNGITISNYSDIRYNKNYQAIGARVTVNLSSLTKFSAQDVSNGVSLLAFDWKLFKKENKEALSNALKSFGLTQAQIIDSEESRFLLVQNTGTPIYKCMFFKNNLTDTPSLNHLTKILHNIHTLDNINDKNHKLINTIYIAKTGKKLTPEQADNISVTVTKDGYGILVVEADEIETNLSDYIPKSVISQNLNNWQNIKSEIETWEEKFKLYAGIPSEKISAQRENIAESLMRTARVNSAEKNYYKWIKKFLDEYQEYFEIKLSYQFDTLISEVIFNSNKKLAIDNVSNNNKLALNDNILKESNDNE